MLSLPRWIVGTGEMADRIRSFLGRTILSVESRAGRLSLPPRSMWRFLHARWPLFIGGAEMILLYNDTYLPHLTTKHPALGKPFWVVWEGARRQVKELMRSP